MTHTHVSVARHGGHHSATALAQLPRRKRTNLYLYYSIGSQRVVSVVGEVALAVALRLEFDANVAAYCERPRGLILERCWHERSFSATYLDGRRRYILIVPAGSQTQRPRYAPCRALKLEDDGSVETVSLDLVFESQVMATGAFPPLPFSAPSEPQLALAFVPRATPVTVMRFELSAEEDASSATLAEVFGADRAGTWTGVQPPRLAADFAREDDHEHLC